MKKKGFRQKIRVTRNNDISYRIAIDMFRVNNYDITISLKPEIARITYEPRYIFDVHGLTPDIDRRSFPKTVSYQSKSRRAINNKRAARSFHFRGIDRVIETVSVQFISLYFPFSFVSDRTRIVHARRDNPEWLLDNCEIRYCRAKKVNWCGLGE